MIQHVWTVPCRVTITDQDTNNVSLIEVLEELILAPAARFDPDRPKFPVFFDVVTLWTRGQPEVPETGFGRFQLLAPQGEILTEQVMEVDLREVRRLRTFGRIFAFPARGPGVYYFRIDQRAREAEAWQLAATIPLDVAIEALPECAPID